MIEPSRITDERYFTAWEGAQLAYWGDSDPSAPKPKAGQPDPHGPLEHLVFCVLVLDGGDTVVGTSRSGSRDAARQDADAQLQAKRQP